MKIAVVGLGLIGGSLCKAIKLYTEHSCFGLDTCEKTIESALKQKAIDGVISPDELSRVDLTILALHPRATIDFLTRHAHLFRPGSTVMDVCGVKSALVQPAELLQKFGVHFIPAHPMAGREFSGFDFSKPDLFQGASFIVTPLPDTDVQTLKTVESLALSIGFSRVVESTPQEHDQIIAYTSQLAHVVSNAYIKSPTLSRQMGFSAGSFLDLTRVARLNEQMWTSLFLLNREPLLFELDHLITSLEEYRTALSEEDAPRLCELLREGRILKEQSAKETQDASI